jgi:hypothetical protein
LPLELGVLSDVGGDHLADRPRPQQQPEPPVVHAAVVGHDREVLHAAAHEGRDQVLRDAAEAEAPDDQRGAVRHVADRVVRRGEHLVDHPSR